MMYCKVVFMRSEQKKSVKNFFVNKSYYICPVNFKQNMNMKKIILSVVAVMAFGFANAQDKKEGGAGLAKGNLVLTGDFNYQSSTTGDVKSSVLTVAPGVGYMLSDKLMLAGSIGIGSGTVSIGEGDDAKVSAFGLNAGVRYFFTPADNFSLFLGGQLGYGSTTTNVGIGEDGEEVFLEDDLKTTTISLTVPVGLHYFVSDNFAITTTWGGLGYSSSKPDFDGADATNTLSLGLNMSNVSFGLLYKL